jgi:uncharacterized protein (DUF1810 family)
MLLLARRKMALMSDPYNLQRFVDAQAPPEFDNVCAELRNGQKINHWMWYIFPQIEGLGTSQTAQKFAISSRVEAEAFLQHPVLSQRLRFCTQLVNLVDAQSIDKIFSYPDNLKFHSSMTLFSHISPDDMIFKEALRKYFDNKRDQATLKRL